MYKVLYLPIAREDIAGAVEYLVRVLEAPKAASDLLDELDDVIKRISRFPYANSLYRTDRPLKDEIRKVSVKNYVLYYAIFDDTVEIRRFLHGKKGENAFWE